MRLWAYDGNDEIAFMIAYVLVETLQYNKWEVRWWLNNVYNSVSSLYFFLCVT